ncbi:MAG: VWA domain-containing protein [Victivallales bacterium]|nr:VWA domain-containing protein [Victivallales bacterium]MBT7165950.1 VWA domain-containing protein [Victivallales bacterium]
MTWPVFESPYALLLLLLLPLLVWRRLRRRQRRAAIGFSSIAHALRSGTSWRQVFVGLPYLLRLAALALLIVALARPQQGTNQVRDASKGVAIEMVVDRSGSMGKEMEFEGSTMNRLEVVKNVFRQFVEGDEKALAGRPNDLIGMVAFALYPDTMCPLTLGHGALTHFLDTVRLVPERSPENRTAIGDALALAGARLETAEDTMAKQTGEAEGSYEIQSKVIILLTDGQNNAGEKTPQDVVPLLKEWKVKVYAIGIGDDNSIQRQETALGVFLMATRNRGPSINMDVLEDLASETGGKAFLATDGASLRRIYEEIDQLERSEIRSIRFVDYREVFPIFALVALALLALEVILNCTAFRKIP